MYINYIIHICKFSNRGACIVIISATCKQEVMESTMVGQTQWWVSCKQSQRLDSSAKNANKCETWEKGVLV